jgi:transaldolase
MGASFRKTDQILNLAGCDLLTIAPELLEQLQNTDGEEVPKLTVQGARNAADARLHLDEKTYRWMHNEDQMAVEKLSEGIRRFNEDARKLERWAQTAVTTA